MGAVRHLAGPNAVAGDVGLSRAKFDAVVRLAAALTDELEVDESATAAQIARDTGATADQVSYVWRAWVRTEPHPAGRR